MLKINFRDRIEVYTYEEMYDNMGYNERNAFLKSLYEQKEDIKLACICIKGKEIPLYLSYTRNKTKDTTTYYIARNDIKQEHAQGCNFEGKAKNNKKAWDMKEDGNISVKIQGYNYNNKSGTEGSESPGEGGNTRPYSSRRIGQNRTTFNGFIRHWLSDTWDHKSNIIYNQYKRGISYNEFYSFLMYKAIKIKFNAKVSAADVLSTSPKNVTNKSNKYRAKELLNGNLIKGKKLNMLVLARLNSQKDIIDLENGFYKILLIQPKTKETFEYVCTKEMWKATINGNVVKTPPYMVGAFVEYKNWNDPLEMIEVAIVPISDNGVFVESSYEREYYNKAHNEGRAFIKPYSITEFYKSFRGMKPDAIFLDTPDKPTVIEIFGRSENDEYYHIRKEQKIRHFSKLKNYNFECWYAYKGDPIPKLPKKIK